MKFLGLITAFAAVADASHATCATATVATDGDVTNSTFPAHTTAPASQDAPFTTLCGGNDLYQDFFWTYTATCTGVGLVTFSGNVNMSSITLAVTTGTCAAPVLAGQSESSGDYLQADMTMDCDWDTMSLDDLSGEYVQRHQFAATLGTTYTVAAGRRSSSNITGSEPGEEFFKTLIQCSAPASNDCAVPSPITEGAVSFSNIGGAAQSDCTGGNDVFLEYEAPCTGSVNFTMVGGSGYQGEDLEMGIYTGCGGDADLKVCQDDPAIVYANASITDDSFGTNQGLGSAGSMDGVQKGSKYIIKVGSYSSAVAPFIFHVSGCDGDDSTSSASALAAPLLALVALLF